MKSITNLHAMLRETIANDPGTPPKVMRFFNDSDAEMVTVDMPRKVCATMFAARTHLPGLLDRIAALEAALRECADTLEESNTYVAPYFVEKHDLAAPIGRARKLLESP